MLPLPATIAGALSHSTIVVGIIYRAELAVHAVIATVVLFNQRRRSRRDDDQEAVRHSNPAILGYAAAYLVVMSILWAMSSMRTQAPSLPVQP
ncbi:hypothetical protein [Mycobacterium sp. Aquia_213]|uniref:hypothetical protein n=1 Tax=Mycobacterium sp. Aquia_213 TaxID=2991728 RepID=UPI00226FECE6|nr:hypothetical protein [Mycobacterium sp. Aquia_213]WAC90312.1 hypothetical protein LMQ14_20635 [Mycobacterium sp. Aquia_213]